MGAGLLVLGTFLHPAGADPNVPSLAFAEYAADRTWVASHTLQLAGAVALVGSLLLSFSGRPWRAHGAVAVGTATAAATIAATAVLQAVDGIALNNMVDAWAAASGPEQQSLFSAAYAVRQVEIGLAAVSSTLGGASVLAYSCALALEPHTRRAIVWAGVLTGAATMAGAAAMSYTGFSSVAMAITMPAGIAMVAWVVAVAATAGKHAKT